MINGHLNTRSSCEARLNTASIRKWVRLMSGIDSALRASPLRGALRAYKSAAQICRTGFSSQTLCGNDKEPLPEALCRYWRRGWDSNPRKATNLCWFSRPVHSTALPPLRIVVPIQRDQCIDSAHPCASPFGRSRCARTSESAVLLIRRASKIVPDDFVNRSATSPNFGATSGMRRRILRAR